MPTVQQLLDSDASRSAEQRGRLEDLLRDDLAKESTAQGYAQLVVAKAGPQCNTRPNILFIGFAGEQALVDSIGAAFIDVQVMVDKGLEQSASTVFGGRSPYELFFGKAGLFGATGVGDRQVKVRAVLNEIKAKLPGTWVIDNQKKIFDDVASWALGERIMIGSGFARASGKFAAGVLIHEMGHRAGLVDVCSICRSQDLAVPIATPNVFKASTVKCDKNNLHSRDIATKGGHYVSIDRCVLLGDVHGNLAVWNADSYRWYCCYFFQAEVAAGLKALNGQVLYWPTSASNVAMTLKAPASNTAAASGNTAAAGTASVVSTTDSKTASK